VSVPAPVRQKLGLGPGAILEWDADGDEVIVRRVGRYSSEDVHRALFAEPPVPRTRAEMKDGVRQVMRRRHAKR
jgi:bifunctional DNA-binding transcriptional regulator/antitoxin component of YhaV-PrlF toxin-antitoxin module